MSQHSGPIRALVAVGVKGIAVVVAHDSQWLYYDIDGISDLVEDLGLCLTPESGIFLWEGTAKVVNTGGWDMPVELENEYTGKLRPVRPDELAELLAMEPPDVDGPHPEPEGTHAAPRG